MLISRQAIATLFVALTTSASAATLRSKISSCTNHESEDHCYGATDTEGDDCVWCDCEAVPSMCASASEAARLPDQVFECGAARPAVEEKTTSIANLTFNFKGGVTHSIQSNLIDKSFCDDSSPLSMSGYVDITGSKFDTRGEEKHLFYWFSEKRATELATDTSIPLVIWLTGGPGCSSTLALLTENGPCSVKKTADGTEKNPHSWTESAHMLWLDQPAGVGYSYGKETDKNEEMVGEDAYYFIQAFLQAHPQYKENPLFIFGESFGGHYAPAIAQRVHRGNNDKKKGTEFVNLKGVGVGNGLTDPEIQYKYYAEMGHNNPHGIKAFGEIEYNLMKKAEPTCTDMIHTCTSSTHKLKKYFQCQKAFNFCNMAFQTPYQLTGLNVYDMSKKCEVKPLCYDFSHVTTFLNKDSTKKALNISKKSHKWASCNMGINLKFREDWMQDFAPAVKELLEADIRVLIYAGDLDYICNYMGNQAWTLALDWKHKEEFNKAEPHDWNNKKGLARTSNGFTFLQVYDAGHMSPADQPEATLDMLTQFLKGEAAF